MGIVYWWSRWVYISCLLCQSLKSNYHVNCYLKERVNNQLNYLTRILGEHGDIINLGEALCNSVIRPSLTHGCSILMSLSTTSKEALESMQYRAMKIVLPTKIRYSEIHWSSWIRLVAHPFSLIIKIFLFSDDFLNFLSIYSNSKFIVIKQCSLWQLCKLYK